MSPPTAVPAHLYCFINRMSNRYGILKRHTSWSQNACAATTESFSLRISSGQLLRPPEPIDSAQGNFDKTTSLKYSPEYRFGVMYLKSFPWPNGNSRMKLLQMPGRPPASAYDIRCRESCHLRKKLPPIKFIQGGDDHTNSPDGGRSALALAHSLLGLLPMRKYNSPPARMSALVNQARVNSRPLSLALCMYIFTCELFSAMMVKVVPLAGL